MSALHPSAGRAPAAHGSAEEPRLLETAAGPTARPRFFYGWLIVLASALGMFATGPGQTFIVAIFVDPIGASLGLSKTAISTSYTLAGTLAAVLVLQVGRLIDRFGTRRALLGIGVVFGLTCAAMSTVNGMLGLVVGFAALRIGGPGALSLASTVLPTRWFVQRRGLALGLVMLGVGLSHAVLPTATTFLVEAVGWRNAWLVLAGMVWALVLLPAALVVRDRPEEMGLHPDGRPARPVSGARAGHAAADRVDWTPRQATRTPAFWILMANGIVSALVGTGIIFHQVSYFAEQGRADQLLLVFAIFGVIQTSSMTVTGVILDRFAPRFVMAWQYFLLLAAILLLLVIGPLPVLIPVYAIVVGMAMGGNGTLSSVIWPTYFGSRHVATLRSMDSGVKMVAAAVGPLPLAAAFDYLGGFEPGLLLFAVLALTATLLSFWCTPPTVTPAATTTASPTAT